MVFNARARWLTGPRGRVVALAACLVAALPAGMDSPARADGGGLEGDVVAEINALRTDPAAWSELLAARRVLYDDDGVLRRASGPPVRTAEGVSALDEAVAALRAIEPRPRLTALPVLETVAREHVVAAGPSGQVGHSAPDGLTLDDRLLRHGVDTEEVAEAIAYGPSVAREVVASLVLDDGVAGRPHRDMILDPRYVAVGVACGPHARYRTMCIVLLAVPASS